MEEQDKALAIDAGEKEAVDESFDEYTDNTAVDSTSEDDEDTAVDEDKIKELTESGFSAFASASYEEAANLFMSANSISPRPMGLFGEGIARLYQNNLDDVRAFSLKTNQALEMTADIEEAKKIILLSLKPHADLREKVESMKAGTKKKERNPYIIFVDNCIEFSYFMALEIENRNLLDDVEINAAYYKYIKAVIEYFRKVDRLPRIDRVRYKRDVDLFRLAQISLKNHRGLPENEELYEETLALAETVENERVSDDKKARKLTIFMIVFFVILIAIVNSLLMKGIA